MQFFAYKSFRREEPFKAILWHGHTVIEKRLHVVPKNFEMLYDALSTTVQNSFLSIGQILHPNLLLLAFFLLLLWLAKIFTARNIGHERCYLRLYGIQSKCTI